MTIEVRDVRRSDLRSIMAIDAAVYPSAWTKRLWTQELNRAGRVYRCAVVDRSVVGVAGILLTLDEAHVMTVAVAPSAQRRGVATTLMIDAAHQAIAAGATAMTLEVRESNAAAQALYSRFGFEAVGVRRGYYEPDGEDAMVMWAKGITSPEFAARLAKLADEHSEETV